MNFERADDVPDGSVLETDLCVVGSGAAGITLARELDKAKLQVLVLEAGGLERDEPMEEESFAIEHLGIPFGNPLPTRGRWFGGSTNLWVGRMAMLDPIDFEERPWVPYSGWPLRHDELQPWVQKAAAILDVPDFERITIDRWSSHPAFDTFVRQGGAALGVFLWADGLYMGPRNRDVMRTSTNLRVLLDATATELIPNEASTVIDALAVRGRRGNPFSVKAVAYVLAAGGLENPRLLLASTCRSTHGVGNGNDLVGRFYMDHPRGEGLAIVDLKDLTPKQFEWLLMLGDHPAGRRGRMQFRLTFPPEMQRHEQLLNHALHADFAAEIHGSESYLGAKRLIDRAHGKRPDGGADLVRDLVVTMKGAPQLLARGIQSFRKRALPSKMFLIDQMEQEPDPSSRVSVDWTRKDRWGLPKLQLDWRIGASTYRSQHRMHGLFKGILEKFGIRTVHSTVLERPEEVPRLIEMKHPTGTTRMSSSPKNGVVDSDLRVHGVENLYVVGTSTFPTAGHANPTLLIVGLAARLADHLSQRGSESARR